MVFPSIVSLLQYHHIFLISGPLAIIVALFLIRSIRQQKSRRPPVTLIVSPAIALYIGVYHIWNTGVQLRNAMYFRALTEDTVAALEIEPMANSLPSSQAARDAQPLRPTTLTHITEADQVSKALQLLDSAAAISRSTAPLQNGYRIKLIRAAAAAEDSWPTKGLYLSVYDRRAGSGPGEPSMIVVPHVGPDLLPTTHGGYFTCPEFMAWVTERAK